MKTRHAWFVGMLIMSLVPVEALSQSWKPARVAGGQPDLQGIWTNGTATPLERPPEFAGKEFLTDQEIDMWEKQTAIARNSDRRRETAKEDLQWAYNNTWYD
jgi:hypothetical protein